MKISTEEVFNQKHWWFAYFIFHSKNEKEPLPSPPHELWMISLPMLITKENMSASPSWLEYLQIYSTNKLLQFYAKTTGHQEQLANVSHNKSSGEARNSPISSDGHALKRLKQEDFWVPEK